MKSSQSHWVDELRYFRVIKLESGVIAESLGQTTRLFLNHRVGQSSGKRPELSQSHQVGEWNYRSVTRVESRVIAESLGWRAELFCWRLELSQRHRVRRQSYSRVIRSESRVTTESLGRRTGLSQSHQVGQHVMSHEFGYGVIGSDSGIIAESSGW